jgi:DNA-binding IclR family transcriptional regulator
VNQVRRLPKTSPDRELAKAVEASKAPAISRAAAVLRLLGRSDLPLGVHAIARELGLVPSTCLHVLRALVAEEFVSFDPDTKRYALEAGVLSLARQWLRRNRFTDLAQPHLDRIAEAFEVMLVGTHIVGREHMVVVGISQAGSGLQLSTQIGSRFPALVSATGRLVAAHGELTDDDLERRFATLRWDEPPSFEQWQAEVQQAGQDGYAVDEGHYIGGVTVIAAPVWKGRDRMSHALAAIGLSSTIRRHGVTELREAIVAAAASLSDQMGEMTGD